MLRILKEDIRRNAFDELMRIIVSDNAAEGILFLRSTGLLEQILPELDACFTIDQKSKSSSHL